MSGGGVWALPWDDGKVRCALCGSEDGAAEHALTHGVRVTLCATHRSNEYLGDDGGHTIAGALENLWAASGCLTVRRRRALAAHPRRMSAAVRPAARKRPGSYAWPHVRRAAEDRFAAGEPPQRVMTELRAAHQGDAHVPSLRTMRRWFIEARWMHPDPDEPSTRLELIRGAIDRIESEFSMAQALPGWSTPQPRRHGPRKRRRRRRRRRR